MSEENEQNQAEPNTEEQQEELLTTEKVSEIVSEKINEVEERYKKEISGLNRRNSDLEKKLEQEQLKGKSEAEKIEIERQRAIEEAAAAKSEAEQYRIGLLREKLIHEAGLTPNDSVLITAPDEDGIKKQVDYLKQHDKEVADRAVETVRKEWFGGGKPNAGNTDKKLTYDDLVKMPEEELQKLPAKFTEQIFGGN